MHNNLALVIHGTAQKIPDDTQPEPLLIEQADLPRRVIQRRWVVLCFSLTFLIYISFIPQIIKFSSPPTGDQPFYLMDAISLVQDGDLELSNNYANRDEDKFYSLAPHPADFVGMSAPYPLTPQMAISSARPDEEIYGFHPPGLSFLITPAVLIGSWFSLWWPATIVFMCVVGALVATNVFLLAFETTGRTWIAWAVWLALAFSSPLMSYSYLIFSELAVGLVTVYAFRRLALGWKANGPWRLLVIGACIGFIPWLAIRCLPIAAGLGLYALAQWWRSAAPGDLPRLELKARIGRAKEIARKAVSSDVGRGLCFIAPIVILALLLGAYHLNLYNSVIPPSDERGGSGVGTFYMPWQGQYELKKFVTGAFGLLYSQTFGLLNFTPVYLLAVVGVFAMFRTGNGWDKSLVKWIGVVAIPYLALISSYSHWGGDWCPPARYASSLVPLLAAPLAASLAALSASRVYKALYGAFALIGFGFMSIMLYNPITMWSASSSAILDWMANDPNSPLKINMRTLMPRFFTPDEVWFPWRTGWLLVASILIVAVGVLLLMKHSPEKPARPWSLSSLVPRISVPLALLVLLLAGWVVINYDFLRSKTTFEFVSYWEMPVQFIDPGDIAYLDGRIYIPQFGARLEDDFDYGDVGVFDLETARYSPFVARTQDGEVVPWTHPGSVSIGPDGYLYVLNNSEESDDMPVSDALLVMEADGTIVRQITLENKTLLGKGVYFGEDGSFYVSDQLNGAVLHYASTGGEPLKVFMGMDSILNNPRGVAVDDEGYVYTSEMYNRIQKLNANDELVAEYELYCIPRYFAASNIADEWLDATCRTGLLSINTHDNYVQLAQYRGDGPRPVSPTGLAYGDEDILYVMDGSRLLAYRVTH